MGKYVASEVVKLMIANDIKVKGAKALILGITFKENCPDIRNTRVVDIVYELQTYGVAVEICDPWADPQEVQHEYNLTCSPEPTTSHHYEAIILAVAHQQFKTLPIQTFGACDGCVVYDIKGVLPQSMVAGRL